MIEEQPYIDLELNEPEIASDYKKPIHISMSCAENSQELRSIYEKYLKLPHDYTNETTIVYRGRYDNLARFDLYFPGGVIDQTRVELFDIRDDKLTLVSKKDNFITCTELEKLKIGKDYPCFLPDKNEFSTVSY